MKLTLCGSARYEMYWHEANKLLGLQGHICYSLMTFPSIEGEKTWYTPEQKTILDLAHFAKIQNSDGVVMLNIDGYLGESSLRELQFARMQSKHVYWTIFNNNPYMISSDRPMQELLFLTDKSIRWGEDWTQLLENVKAKHPEPQPHHTV